MINLLLINLHHISLVNNSGVLTLLSFNVKMALDGSHVRQLSYNKRLVIFNRFSLKIRKVKSLSSYFVDPNFQANGLSTFFSSSLGLVMKPPLFGTSLLE